MYDRVPQKMVTVVRWEAHVEKAFFLPVVEDIFRMAIMIEIQEKMTTSTVDIKLNPTKTASSLMLMSVLEHERARIGGTSQKKWLMALDLQKDKENVKPVCTEAFMEPMTYEPATKWMQTLRDMTMGQ